MDQLMRLMAEFPDRDVEVVFMRTIGMGIELRVRVGDKWMRTDLPHICDNHNAMVDGFMGRAVHKIRTEMI